MVNRNAMEIVTCFFELFDEKFRDFLKNTQKWPKNHLKRGLTGIVLEINFNKRFLKKNGKLKFNKFLN
jgi:hypothetical protein